MEPTIKPIETVYNGYRFRSRLSEQVTADPLHPFEEHLFGHTALSEVTDFATGAHILRHIANRVVNPVQASVQVATARVWAYRNLLHGGRSAIVAGHLSERAELIFGQFKPVPALAGASAILVIKLIECGLTLCHTVMPALHPALSKKTTATTGMPRRQVAVAYGALVPAITLTQPHAVMALAAADAYVGQHSKTPVTLSNTVYKRFAHRIALLPTIISHTRCIDKAARQARFEFGERGRRS